MRAEKRLFLQNCLHIMAPGPARGGDVHMERCAYDFHIHSCLSPCGDADMTPNNIVNMALLKGLDVIALTDHNSCRNCPATVEVGRKAGLLVLPGMELCTNEDIHVVCLFEALEGAMGFDAEIEPLLPPVPNRPDIFGPQMICDEADNLTGRVDTLLLNAADISVVRVLALARQYGGTAYPAHADRPANGIIGALGAVPPEAGFTAVEISAGCKDEVAFLRSAPGLTGLRVLRGSDAHYLWQISERQFFLELPALSASDVLSTINMV